MIPILTKYLPKLKGYYGIPVGVVTQYTINDICIRRIKNMIAYDILFPPLSNLSVNDRLYRDLFIQCFYGHFVLRVLPYVTHLQNPLICLLLLKIDLDAVYS